MTTEERLAAINGVDDAVKRSVRYFESISTSKQTPGMYGRNLRRFLEWTGRTGKFSVAKLFSEDYTQPLHLLPFNLVKDFCATLKSGSSAQNVCKAIIKFTEAMEDHFAARVNEINETDERRYERRSNTAKEVRSMAHRTNKHYAAAVAETARNNTRNAIKAKNLKCRPRALFRLSQLFLRSSYLQGQLENVTENCQQLLDKHVRLK